MNRHNSVLLYGTDPLVQEAKWLLQFFDSSILLSPKLSDLAQVPVTPPVDLLILWDSTSLEEREAAISFASRQWPASKSLILAANAAINATTLLSRVSNALER
jgi:hypothetical protein